MKRFPVVVCSLLMLMHGAMTATAAAAQDTGQVPGAGSKADKKKTTQKKTDGNKGGEQKPPEQNATEKKPDDTTKTQSPPPQLERREGTITNIGKDGASLLIKTLETNPANPDQKEEKIRPLLVKDQALKDGLKNWHVGDKVKAAVNVDKKDGVETLTLWNLEPQTIVLGEWWMPALVMLGSLVALLLLTWLLTLKFGGILALLFVGQDGKYSNSKTQMALWFTLVIVTYVSALAIRWHEGITGLIGIPANLLALTGMSGLTFAGAKGITSQKVATANAAAAAVPVAAAAAAAAVGTAPHVELVAAHAKAQQAAAAAPQGKTGLQSKFPQDFIQTDDGKYDFGDYQMIVITLIAVLGYMAVACHFLSNLELRGSIQMPDVDGTMAALFGVGQGAYLTKKAVTDIKS